MIFKIRRTSRWDDENPSIDGAVKRQFENWQIRSLSEDAFNEKFGEREGLWRSKGKNHKHDERGYCMRQMKDVMFWSIEINTLEELMKIAKECLHPIILSDDSLEIYDDYRE